MAKAQLPACDFAPHLQKPGLRSEDPVVNESCAWVDPACFATHSKKPSLRLHYRYSYRRGLLYDVLEERTASLRLGPVGSDTLTPKNPT
jgi:hypothetical protein